MKMAVPKAVGDGFSSGPGDWFGHGPGPLQARETPRRSVKKIPYSQESPERLLLSLLVVVIIVFSVTWLKTFLALAILKLIN